MPGPPLRAGLFSRYADGVAALRQQLMSSAIGDTNDAHIPADFLSGFLHAGEKGEMPSEGW